MTRHILAIDQGTTSSRAILFNETGKPLTHSAREFPQHYPHDGWVEHDPEDIWRDTVAAVKAVVTDETMAIGITNQRETIVLWNRETGKPLYNAIVWQDRRTADICRRLKAEGHEAMIRAKTGLLLDPYFSATKLAWLLDHVEGAREAAAGGKLAAGTIDSFLLWRLTGGRVHATDITNAGRTMLCNIHKGTWDEELLALFDIHPSLLPEIVGNSEIYGETDPGVFGRAIPIAGMAGDQQAALIGQACFLPGMVKSTYGTGCFLLLNTGTEAVTSHNRLLTTPAYKIGTDITYALEGSIFVAGAAIQWLRDKMGLIEEAGETAAIAKAAPDNHGVYLVPAFVGLGAPHWEPDARGLISGMTLDTTAEHIVRATLESIAYQTRDLVDAMRADGADGPQTLRIDGGMAQNDWFAQFLSDILESPVERPASHETTALGAAYLAGLATGLWSGLDDLSDQWEAAGRFEPAMENEQRDILLKGWRSALNRALP
ncbi:glycerol kinase GlpK [Parasphingopyxis lamellibrachiae]|uniref:Glycerol kinase n=1 Tax=Parasphingopyxis lamellibrachiae TaxID=680125 RepID=A0A3D9FCB2_9SPHN|nr:glycerol kinase GlpK [Parasphingopyxis lamellibrachiae]RED15207.1 glycerol kinase [Parasphingopyxis lamellibrachiae]